MPISTIGSNSLNQTSDLTINGQTVGKGGGNVATNTAHGVSALAANTSGSLNVAVGSSALLNNTSGAAIVAVGSQALKANTTGSDNTVVGRDAGLANTTGGSLSALGQGALLVNTTGSSNTAIGSEALRSNTTASNNTAVGYQALYSNTTGAPNTAVGNNALYANTTGQHNVAIGGPEANNVVPALRFNTTGSYNNALGNGALGLNTTNSYSTAIGYKTLYASTADANTAIGYNAGTAVTTGGSNVFVGSNAGVGANPVTTGAYNVCIGNSVSASGSGASGELVIGAAGATTGKGSSTGFINPNGGGVYQGNNSGTWSQVSDRRLKKNIVNNTDGLDKITALQIRNFEYRLPEEVEELESTCAVPNTGIQLGVIAQEIQAVLPDCVKEESTGVLSVDSDNLTWYMVNAIKDLKTIVDAQAAEIAELKAKVA